MEYRKIFGLILDLGAAMIGCGGETRRVTTAVRAVSHGGRRMKGRTVS